MAIIVKTQVKNRIKTDGSWLDAMIQFIDILELSDGDMILYEDGHLNKTEVSGWDMVKVKSFIDQLANVGYNVSYLKTVVCDYNTLKDFKDDVVNVFNETIKIAEQKFSQKPTCDEMEA